MNPKTLATVGIWIVEATSCGDPYRTEGVIQGDETTARAVVARLQASEDADRYAQDGGDESAAEDWCEALITQGVPADVAATLVPPPAVFVAARSRAREQAGRTFYKIRPATVLR